MSNASMPRRCFLKSMAPALLGASPVMRSLPSLAEEGSPPLPIKPGVVEKTAFVLFEMPISQDSMNSLQLLLIDLNKNNFKNITIMINSFGGNVAAVIAAYNFLNAMPLNISTYNMCDVDSAAIILFLAGKNRMAGAQSSFSFHSVRNEYKGTYSPEELTRLATEIEAINNKMRDIYRYKMTLKEDEFQKLLYSNTTTVSAAEALNMGLVTKLENVHIDTASVFMVPVPPAPKT